MAALFTSSLSEVELRPEQKQPVADIEHDLETLGEPPKEARDQLINDVADGVAAGKIDKPKTDADIKKLSDAAAAKTASIQDAVNRLHKTLDPAQRKKLVETMRAKGEEMKEKMKEHMHEHAEGGHEGGHGEMGEHGEHEGDHEAEEHKEHEKLADELGLTPEQREKLHAKMKEEMKSMMATRKARMEKMHQHMKAVGDAFETDTFDAKKAGVGEHGPEMVKEMATMRVHMAEAILPILTPDQRAKFSAHLKAHAEDGDD
jgi:Spy/CpxP family protein refolding chaperone